MKTVTLSLPDSLVTQLEQNFAYHGYENVSDYVTDVLQAHEEREQETLKELLLDGLNSGDPVPATSEFWAELREETDALLAQHQHGMLKASAA